MRFRVCRITACLLLSALVVVGLAAGCGKNENTTDGHGSSEGDVGLQDAQTLFGSSLRSLADASSFRLSGSMDMSMRMRQGSQVTPVSMNVLLSEDVRQDGGSQRIKGDMQITQAEGMQPTSMTVYLVDDRIYFENDGQWLFSEYLQSYNPMGGTSQLITSRAVSQMLENAETVETEESDGGSVTFHLTLGQKYFSLALQEMERYLQPAQVDSIRKMFDSINYDMHCTVSRESGRMESMRIDMRGEEFEFMPGAFITMEVRSDFVFSDYDADLTVELPPEAANARHIELGGEPF
jgi:hypothetical protein